MPINIREFKENRQYNKQGKKKFIDNFLERKQGQVQGPKFRLAITGEGYTSTIFVNSYTSPSYERAFWEKCSYLIQMEDSIDFHSHVERTQGL